MKNARKKIGYFKYIIAKEFNRINVIISKRLKIDPLTHTKIHSRYDLISIGNGNFAWVIPQDLMSEESICYCIGCGSDISFDIGVIKKFGCDVHAFDPTPASIEYCKKASVGNSKFNFHEFGVWHINDTLRFYVPFKDKQISHSLVNIQKTDSYIYVEVKKLTDIMAQLGHKSLDLIKIDIEGAEYELVELIVNEFVFIKILCIEYDEIFNHMDNKYVYRIRHSIRKLKNAGYRLVADQGFGNFTFIHKSFL